MTAQIAIINATTVMTDADAKRITDALTIQVTRDFGPAYGLFATLQFFGKGQKAPADWWWLSLLDNADAAGALGYHDLTPAGLPLGKAFIKTDLDNGYSPSVTISHELLEMLADPYIAKCTQSGTTLYAYEVCDAVEADKYSYGIDLGDGKPSVLVSNFVLERWFYPTEKSGPFDFRSQLKKPLQLESGGYIGIWDPHQGWHQKTAEGHTASHLDIPRVGSRRERRMRLHRGELLLRSTVEAT